MIQSLKEIYSYKEMIRNMVRKDLRGRYKGSVLGFFWTILNPILQLLVYTFLFSVVLKTGIDKYYLFLFVALVPWIFFSSCLVGGSGIILGQKDLVKKIYFPIEVLPICHVTSNFINMLLSFIVIFAVVIISGSKITYAALYLPVVMIIEYIFALGVAYISSAITVYFRDMEQILGIAGMAWMYLTPVMYSVDMIPEEFYGVLTANPMSPIILAYRDVLYYGKVPEATGLLTSFLLGVIILVAGFALFNKLKRRFVEEL
jgi:ABC-2 type transport system permease protein